jgi:hypothetical protein
LLPSSLHAPLYLDLQNVAVTANAAVVHVVVGLVRISAILVLDECEAADACCQYVFVFRQDGLSGTHSLLDAERGAGMSQRTSLP